jgi:hypothetical protein
MLKFVLKLKLSDTYLKDRLKPAESEPNGSGPCLYAVD